MRGSSLMPKLQDVRIAVVGLGYVGLPLALAFAEVFRDTVGFDIDLRKLDLIREGVDPCGEGFDQQIQASSLFVTSEEEHIQRCNFFIVTVPTPIDHNNFPDLRPLNGACRTIGNVLKAGDTVVFESTVYPGLTEEVCLRKLEEQSGLVGGKDFFIGYSPERINPGDKEHSLATIVKVVAGQTEQTTKLLRDVYGSVVKAGIHCAPSIKVAEAAKVIENTQRDLNIALMNELAIIFDKLNISTKSVLDAASTKWNFLRFTPGLVGGHCIGVDPYYLTAKAQQLGYHPQVILAGRRINDDMGRWIAQRAVKLLANQCGDLKSCKVGILGLTFKEDIFDMRNSRVPEVFHELQDFGLKPLAFDPHVEPISFYEEYSIEMTPIEKFVDLDCLILAVGHQFFRNMGPSVLSKRIKNNGIFMDVKSLFSPEDFGDQQLYWSL
jgi:UDP-N-acetyl-D-glucosamine/UDP-N-acetyl-D-galactosamine dehydrogenase